MEYFSLIIVLVSAGLYWFARRLDAFQIDLDRKTQEFRELSESITIALSEMRSSSKKFNKDCELIAKLEDNQMKIIENQRAIESHIKLSMTRTR